MKNKQGKKPSAKHTTKRPKKEGLIGKGKLFYVFLVAIVIAVSLRAILLMDTFSAYTNNKKIASSGSIAQWSYQVIPLTFSKEVIGPGDTCEAVFFVKNYLEENETTSEVVGEYIVQLATLGKLPLTYNLYWEVVKEHQKVASSSLEQQLLFQANEHDMLEPIRNQFLSNKPEIHKYRLVVNWPSGAGMKLPARSYDLKGIKASIQLSQKN